jgi:hypothetical protein
LRRFTALVFGKRFLREMIEASSRDILLQLAIPRLPVALDEPGAKRRKFFGRKLLDFSFEGLNFRHDGEL